MSLPKSSLAAIGSLSARLSATSREARSIVDIPLEAISPNPQQPRKFFDPKRLEELAASIKEKGIQQPVVVTELEPGKYELVFGERRWRAARAAALTHVPAVIKDKLSDKDKLVFALIENLDREEMTPYDEAVGVANLVDLTSVQEASFALNKAKPWISKRVAIAKAPDFVTAFAASGTVGDGEALYELAKLAADNPDQARGFIQNYQPGGHLRAQVKAAQRQEMENPEGDDAGDALTEASGGKRGGGGEAKLGRGGGVAGERDEDEGVSHAKQPPPNKPIDVRAVVRRSGEIFLVTPDGKLRVKFSAQAKKQLATILDS